MNKYHQYVLSLGHLCSDINQSILSAIIPFLIASYHYDYTTAALLVTVSNVCGSLVQPFIGMYIDRKNNPMMMVLGVIMAAGGMALTGWTSNFYLLCVEVMISGMGVALFHPQAAKLVDASSSHNKKGKGMSIFSFGGKIGFTLGPVFTAFLIQTFGMKGTIFFLIPAVIFSIVCTKFNHSFRCHEEIKEVPVENQNQKDNWGGFIRLCVVVFSRSILTNGLSTFLSLYFIQNFLLTKSKASLLLSVYYAVGSIATLFGGSIADHFGHRKMIRISFFILLPAMMIFSSTHHIALALCMLVLMSCGESFSYSPMVVMGQKYLPNHTGFASGVTLGLAVSIGAILCPLLGYVCDSYSLTTTFYIMSGIAGIALLGSMLLPEIR